MNVSQEWTRFEYTAPTWSEPVGLFLGIEDRGTPQTGSIWFDDVHVEETALLNVVRRDGAPLRLRSSSTFETFTETVDYSYVEDPFWSHWQIKPEDDPNLHPMPQIQALAGGRLRAGQTLELDYYALVPVYDGTAASCLTHPAIRDYVSLLFLFYVHYHDDCGNPRPHNVDWLHAFLVMRA